MVYKTNSIFIRISILIVIHQDSLYTISFDLCSTWYYKFYTHFIMIVNDNLILLL